MQGIAAQTGMSGSAWLPFTKKLAIGARKNICIRYMLNESREMPVIHRGASFCSMQVNIRKAPKVASSTLGVQNSHDADVVNKDNLFLFHILYLFLNSKNNSDVCLWAATSFPS